MPTSNSFPSGHSASAAAFALGVSAESPTVGVAVQGLAALVGLSRIATGAHYPSDVAAGFALGSAVSALGTRLLPTAHIPKTRPIPPLNLEMPKRSTGEGLICVVNPRSGSGTGERVCGKLEKLLPDAEIIRTKPDDDIDAVFADAASRADVLGVAGGDGTIRAAAECAMKHDVPLAVFPAGTFNHFARTLGVTVEASAKAVSTGEATKIDVGLLNGEVFLNTASAGSYPEFVRQREALEGKVGKPIAAAIAAHKLMRTGEPFTLRYDNREYTLAGIFIGNGRYDPPGYAPVTRLQMDDGQLDIRLLETGSRFARAKTLLAVLTGRLGKLPLYHEFDVPKARLDVVGESIPLARDGEVADVDDHLELEVVYRALTVYRPKKKQW